MRNILIDPPRDATEWTTVAGFVVVSDDIRWGVANWVWRAIFDRVAEQLPLNAEPGKRVRSAIDGGLHYLDLTDASSLVRAEIGSAVASVKTILEADGDGEWSAPVPFGEFLVAVDGLVDVLPAD